MFYPSCNLNTSFSKRFYNLNTFFNECSFKLNTSFIYYSKIKFYDEYSDITGEVINKLLANQEITITQIELNKLKKIPGVMFDLPFNDQIYPSFVGLIGRPKTRGCRCLYFHS